MHYSSFFQLAAFAALTSLVDVSHAAPQAPGFSGFGGFGKPGSGSGWSNMGNQGGPPFGFSKPSFSTVCFTSSKAPAIKGRPATDYTTLTTCTTTSTLVVTTTVSPPPAVTTSTIVTTSTTTGPTSTNTATTTIVTTTTEMTTLPIVTVNTETTLTQTVSIRESSPFKNIVDTLPPATFSKKKRLNLPGTTPNIKFKLSLQKLPSSFAGDVNCVVHQSECAVITETSTSFATLASTTTTSLTTSTVIVTSIPVANTTVTATSTATTTSTITPIPTTATSTVTTTFTTTIQFDKCSPSNMVGGINGKGISAIDPGLGDYLFADVTTSLDCCLAGTGNPRGTLWIWNPSTGSCYVFTSTKCSGIDQSSAKGVAYTDSYYAPGSGFIFGNANCGSFDAWK